MQLFVMTLRILFIVPSIVINFVHFLKFINIIIVLCANAILWPCAAFCGRSALSSGKSAAFHQLRVQQNYSDITDSPGLNHRGAPSSGHRTTTTHKHRADSETEPIR